MTLAHARPDFAQIHADSRSFFAKNKSLITQEVPNSQQHLMAKSGI
jgi:hypothetical protein